MFEIYGRKNCSWCDAAKALLERKGLQYLYHDIEEDPKALGDFRWLFVGAKTVPQIVRVFADENDYSIVGGYQALEKYIEVHF